MGRTGDAADRSAAENARALFDKGQHRQAREAALAALESQADDPGLLRLAGRAGVEIGADDAVDQLQRVTELCPDDAAAWLGLGDALAADGRTAEAARAFERVLELRPDDEVALTHLGHTAYASGRDAEAVSYLEQAADRVRGSSSATISLVEMYKSMGQYDEALATALKVAGAEPEDVPAALDVAELSLKLGRLDDALGALERIRDIEELQDHQVYALQGMIQVEIERERWDRALELAREAIALDEHGRTADVVAFLEAQVSGERGESTPDREEVEAALARWSGEHRRLHAEDPRMLGEAWSG